jgi:parallel beta-helix repeat protein
MRSNVLSITLSLLLVITFYGSFTLFFELAPNVQGGTIYVPTNYPTIQKAIDAAIPGDTIYVLSGTYQEKVIVNKTINLVGEDKINTIIDGMQQPGNVIYLKASWVSVTGFTITQGEGGVHVFSGQNNTISGNLFVDNGFGVILEGSHENNVINNNMTSMMYSIFLTSSTSNQIEGNAITNNGDDAIFLTSSSHNDLIDNEIYNNFDIDGIRLSSSNNNDILNNTIFSNINVEGIHLLSSSNNNLIGNNLSANVWGFHLESSTNNLISNNLISLTGQGIALEQSSDSNDIFDNKIEDSYYSFIIDSSSNNEAIGNHISDNDYGILLSDSLNNKIEENTVSDNDVWGIYLYSSASNNITNNLIDHSGTGIHILSGSSDNIITNNTVYNNTEGIRLESSSLNRIYHNDILCNDNQAYDDTNNGNNWDDGYPSAGNFWSDYNGSDFYNGPAQNILGSDGIGDTPYTIDLDSRDNYPLMEPMGNFSFLRPGWNLISVPHIQNSTRLEDVLSQINGFYRAVEWFNVSDKQDSWKLNCSSKPSLMNDLNCIDHTIGFWIYITKTGGVIFNYPGIVPSENQTIELTAGWNLVGYPSLTNHNMTEGLNNLDFGSEVDAVQWFDSSSKTWHFLEEDDFFKIGRGYWIHAKTDCIWEVPL